MATNIVSPQRTYRSGGRAIVIIRMRPSRYSVGILNEEETEAKFIWDWDEQSLDDAQNIAKDICSGYYGSPDEVLKKSGYTMPYPIRRK